MPYYTHNRPFPRFLGDRVVMYSDDGETLATWYEPLPESERVVDVPPDPLAKYRLSVMVATLSFLVGLLF